MNEREFNKAGLRSAFGRGKARTGHAAPKSVPQSRPAAPKAKPAAKSTKRGY